MCGIAGLILSSGAPPPEPATLSKLIDSLRHRGPDGAGHAMVGRVTLVHNRLSIIDLVTGDQPLFAGPASLVCNGEIYNYRELRVAMPAIGFATNSDCEPPLHLWLRAGADYAQHLRGMYAIAIHERMRRTVTLSRDPFGIKPLYIAQVAGGLAFASEPQALLETGLVARSVRPAAREELFQLQFTTGLDTIFEGIQRLLPGETLTCADGHVLDRRRVSHIPEGGPENIDEDTALERLDRALEESVDLHQRSDVPFGMLLSGGVDSATLLTVMARLNSQPVLAYTAGFDAPGAADEREHAAAVAKALGAKHETIEIDERMVWRHLPEIVACMDDPAADHAIIPTWFLARRARQDVKVLLSGEGGDEIFAGYPRYQSAMKPWWRGGRTMWARGGFDRVDVLRSRPSGWRDGIAAAEAAAADVPALPRPRSPT
jgi:asparagine synthase (glutamine-hydrolysing)